MTEALRVDGVDISHYQSGSLNLDAAKKAGVKWMYHKATEGAGWRDERYDARRKQAKEAGMPFGAYHFARPEGGDAITEARHFLAVAKPKPGDLVPMLDLETNDGKLSQRQLSDWVRTFVHVVQNEIGVKPILYTPFDLDHDLGLLLWVARYNDRNEPPRVPEPWKRWDIWQFSNGQYGTPDSVAGFGHVDLNIMRPGLTVNDLTIPRHADDVPVVQRLHLMHASMQFSDTPKQMLSDVGKIFDRAVQRKVAWITGTEAGAGADPLRELLKDAAAEHGYRFAHERRQDSWIAVRRDLIHGGWDTHYEQVLKGEAKSHTAKGVMAAAFDNRDLGRINVIACHYLTKGRPGAKSPEYRVNVPENTALARAIGAYAKKVGRGSALVFYGGDQNIVDRTDDTFMGEPLTSAWDELKRWENTGHGNIDVIASYDHDGRVKAVYSRALDDKEFPLNTDHFIVESGFDVRTLKR